MSFNNSVTFSDLTHTSIAEHVTIFQSRQFGVSWFQFLSNLEKEIKFSDLLSSVWEKSPKSEVNIFVSKHDEVLASLKYNISL